MTEIENLRHALERWPIVVTGFTGVMACKNFGIFQADVERLLERSVWTHEFASEKFAAEIKELYRAELLELVG